MADYVDDRTCSLLKVNLDTRYEGNRKGEVRKRSMGDIWAGFVRKASTIQST